MKRLTCLREERRWSKSELARRAKLAGTTVGAIENGRIVPYDGQLRKLSKALGYEGELAALLEEVE